MIYNIGSFHFDCHYVIPFGVNRRSLTSDFKVTANLCLSFLLTKRNSENTIFVLIRIALWCIHFVIKRLTVSFFICNQPGSDWLQI